MGDYKASNFLPFGKDELFDSSSEYILYLIKRCGFFEKEICSAAERICGDLSKIQSIEFQELLALVECYLDYYCKVVKAIKLFSGENVGKVESKRKIYDHYDYKLNRPLHSDVLHGVRNTLQHFEERLQDFDEQIDPLAELQFSDTELNWSLRFGKGGFSINRANSKVDISPQLENLTFKSYLVSHKKIEETSVNLEHVKIDLENIEQILEKNLEERVKEYNLRVPSPRGGGIEEIGSTTARIRWDGVEE